MLFRLFLLHNYKIAIRAFLHRLAAIQLDGARRARFPRWAPQIGNEQAQSWLATAHREKFRVLSVPIWLLAETRSLSGEWNSGVGRWVMSSDVASRSVNLALEG